MTTLIGVSLAGRDVLLVGGGPVTARRLARLLDDGAHARIVAPELCDEVRELRRRHDVAWTPRRFRRTDLAGAWLVHTATGDPRTDRDVASACERRRVLCVNASDGAHGTARLSAQTVSGDVVVGVVSDAGVDPRRTARVRDAIEALLTAGRLPLRRRRPPRSDASTSSAAVPARSTCSPCGRGACSPRPTSSWRIGSAPGSSSCRSSTPTRS